MSHWQPCPHKPRTDPSGSPFPALRVPGPDATRGEGEQRWDPPRPVSRVGLATLFAAGSREGGAGTGRRTDS